MSFTYYMTDKSYHSLPPKNTKLNNFTKMDDTDKKETPRQTLERQ